MTTASTRNAKPFWWWTTRRTTSPCWHPAQDRYKVRAANNGERALAIAAGQPRPDLILLDIMMPGMDGYEVCERLKIDPHTADIPVIFLTAKVQVEDEEHGLHLGAVDYITKPISPPIVLAQGRNASDAETRPAIPARPQRLSGGGSVAP